LALGTGVGALHCNRNHYALYKKPLTSPASEFDAFGPLFFLSSCTGPAAPFCARAFLHGKDPIMAIGTVKFFNNDRGYGFIANDEGGKDTFVHISAVERSGMTSLREGQKLSYELETGRDGKVSAANLTDAS
jgi:CspA family cold shock protein